MSAAENQLDSECKTTTVPQPSHSESLLQNALCGANRNGSDDSDARQMTRTEESPTLRRINRDSGLDVTVTAQCRGKF